MEAAAVTSSAAVAGPSNEVTTPAAFDEDGRSAHFAIKALVPSSIPPGPLGLSSPEMMAKELKTIGTRFHEDCHETDLPSPRLRSSRMFKGKGKEAVAIEKERRKPLRLLDLPLDILKLIVKEVTHTNDLTSLALCHSAFHALTIPHIYSRFDIVWPDSSTHAEPRSGVDALTYGLATLVMAEEVFGESPGQRQHAQNNRFKSSGQGRATETQIRRRRGNHYAHFTKKFSLGNGPADWVQEYLISKEGGKMLGTLVALAVARMHSLETFIWDMPTGILRDIWLALSAHGEPEEERECRLEKVWVRWHNNSPEEPTVPSVNIHAAPLPPMPTNGLSGTLPPNHPAALDRVEHPSFSILPPLKSLSVLDIDELAYLDEMAVLVGKSLATLAELRIGIARHAMPKDWVTVWEGDSLQQVDPEFPTAGSLTIGEKRLGGVMGILTGFVCDMRKPKIVLPHPRHLHLRSSSEVSTDELDGAQALEPEKTGVLSTHEAETSPKEVEPESALSYPDPSSPTTSEAVFDTGPIPAIDSTAEDLLLVSGAIPEDVPLEPTVIPAVEEHNEQASETVLQDEGPHLTGVLRLDSLELERVPISVPVMQKAIDWTRLTSLTLLHSPNHEQLWKTLRKQFAPRPRSPTYPSPRRSTLSSPRKGNKALLGADCELEYGLNLKKIHTNTVSPALISFLKETLAPNSLEVLFFQEARNYTSSVAVDAIFRGPLRRHRASLKKVLIDSSEKSPEGVPTNSSRWRRWMLNRDILSFLCSGKMPALRELGLAIDYRDWHFFLQHLPAIPHLRSLYMPFLADHVHGQSVDPRELALQIVDIVALRPEVELCYMGIGSKCYEILENKRGGPDGHSTESALGMHPSGHADATVSDAEDDDDEDVDVEDDDDEDEADEEHDTESDDDDMDDTVSEISADGRQSRLRLREILFYDDKVAIFKARHGRL